MSMLAFKGHAVTCNVSTKLLLKSRRQIFRDAKSLHSNVNRCNTCRFRTSGTKSGDTLLDSDVIQVLTKEIRLSQTECQIFHTEDKPSECHSGLTMAPGYFFSRAATFDLSSSSGIE